jgi:hypothetical protein
MFTIGECTAKSVINAPVESVNLGEWMFTLTSEAYAACSTAHQSAAQGRLPSGKRVSLNVEYVAGFFMVQHYIEDISERTHVITVSPNSLFWLNDEDYAIAQITWELKATKVDANRCEISCYVKAAANAVEYAKLGLAIAKGISRGHPSLEDHVQEETPKFGKDIERKALAGIWK